MAADLVCVTFVVSHGIWNAGETAGFTDTKAASLIDAKIAVPADGAEPAPEPAPAPSRRRGPTPAAEPVPAPEPETV